MILRRSDVHNPNDVTNKFYSEVIPDTLKKYFKLPGRFVRNFPTKIFRRDGSERKMDWLYLVKQYGKEFLTLVEFQSYPVNEKKIEIIADCADYSKTYYGRPVLVIIIITDGFDSSVKEFERTESDILRPVYIQMSQDEIIERLNNLEVKINNHEELSDDESLDIVFLPMFASKDTSCEITEKVTHLFHKDKSLTGVFRGDIAYGLSIMIKKYFDLTDKGKELLKLIKHDIDRSRLRDVIEFEVDYATKSLQKELIEKNEILNQKDKVINHKDEALNHKDEALNHKDEALNQKDEEIKSLKSILKANGIAY